MRRMIGSMAFGLALTLGALTASAQSNESPRQRGGEVGAKRRQPPDVSLLKGITLSAEQKTRLETLHASQRAQMEGSRDQMHAAMTEARAARERGDTASATAKMRNLRAQMNQRRDQQAAAVRQVLSPDQRRQFDTNLAEMKARGDQRDGGGQRGEGKRGGERPAHPAAR